MEGKSKLFNYVYYKISLSLSFSFFPSLLFLSVKKKCEILTKNVYIATLQYCPQKKKKSSSNNVNVYKKETVLVKDIQQIQCFFHITRGINSDSPYSYNLSHWLRYLKICNTSSWKHFYEYIGNMI